MAEAYTVEPLLTATSDGWPPCLQQPFTLAQPLHSHSGLYFRDPCYVATSPLCITTISSPPTNKLTCIQWTGDSAHN